MPIGRAHSVDKAALTAIQQLLVWFFDPQRFRGARDDQVRRLPEYHLSLQHLLPGCFRQRDRRCLHHTAYVKPRFIYSIARGRVKQLTNSSRR